MAIPSDVPRLLNALARHQFYLEGLKAGYTQEFIDMTEKLRRDLRDAFFLLDVEDLSFLTKRQLDLFIRRLLMIQQARYSIYTKKLLDDIREFMDADLDMQDEILRETQSGNKAGIALLAALLTAKRRDRLWITITNAPIPANGVLLEDAIKRFTATGAFNLDSAVRKAWANKATLKGALDSIVGTARTNYRDGMMFRSIPQADALVATILQHVSSIVQEQALSQFFEKYVWVSVMDNRTSPICIDRNGNVYIYGQGPLPPAHWKCRSHTEPYVDGVPPTGNVSFSEWRSRQPDEVKEDMKDGVKPLTLRQFAGKLRLILAG